jgi:hypothetical protein
MTLRKVGDAAVELHQPPTPTFHLESWTVFRLSAPDAIDVSFRCMPRRHAFHHGYIGLFWASYINAPDDKSMYFLGGTDRPNGWQQHCSPAHNNQSTVCKLGHFRPLEFARTFRDCLHRNYSPLLYEEPFFYGLFRNMTLLFLFDADERLRFTHSPSGGGFTKDQNTTNPAWDFQFIVPKYEVNEEYGFRYRVVYRPRMPRSEIIEEHRRWRQAIRGRE